MTIEYDFTEEEKPQWFAACDIVASVSSRESFGIVYVEAWACGKPVIGGRIGAVECVIRDGEDGLLVPCEDPRRWPRRSSHCSRTTSSVERLGRNGREKVLANHRWSIVVEKSTGLYEQVASEWHH